MLGKHRSLDKDLKRSILWVAKVPGVTKIVLGLSECCRHKYPPGHIKVRVNVSGGLKVNGYSGKGVTDIFIRVDPTNLTDKVIDTISDKFI